MGGQILMVLKAFYSFCCDKCGLMNSNTKFEEYFFGEKIAYFPYYTGYSAMTDFR